MVRNVCGMPLHGAFGDLPQAQARRRSATLHGPIRWARARRRSAGGAVALESVLFFLWNVRCRKVSNFQQVRLSIGLVRIAMGAWCPWES